MRIFVVRVFIRRGTLETDTIILRGKSLPLLLIRMPWRLVVRRWVWVGLRVSLWSGRIAVLRLTRRTGRTKGLAMGTVQHWRLFAIPGILAILTGSVLTGNGSSCTGAVDSRSRDECSLRGDGMEQTLLVKANAVLASSIR